MVREGQSLHEQSRYFYDLLGNLDKIQRSVQYAYDRNDRLQTETKLLDSQTRETTAYQWGANGAATEQTGKEVKNAAGVITSKTTMKYNLQGRLSEIVVTTTNSQGQTSKVTQEYVYDASGIKIRQTEITDADNDGAPDSATDTTYVNDQQNHTGYSQVLEEHEATTDANGTKTKTVTYTLGHDVLSQFSLAMQEDIAKEGGQGASLFFLYDGHGSTRGVTDISGTKNLQTYHYDAYGDALRFDAQAALTRYLYSGEQFNSVSGLQYLRARWYSPNNGSFLRLDPFLGNASLPQSFNKYQYGTGSPIMHVDPSGEVAWFILAALADVLQLLTLGMDIAANYRWRSSPSRRMILDHSDGINDMNGDFFVGGGLLGNAPSLRSMLNAADGSGVAIAQRYAMTTKSEIFSRLAALGSRDTWIYEGHSNPQEISGHGRMAYESNSKWEISNFLKSNGRAPGMVILSGCNSAWWARTFHERGTKIFVGFFEPQVDRNYSDEIVAIFLAHLLCGSTFQQAANLINTASIRSKPAGGYYPMLYISYSNPRYQNQGITNF